MRLGIGLNVARNKKTGVPFLLSQFPSAIVAYSLYQLSPTATNCITVVRVSDAAEQTFGFVDKELDVAGLETWLGSSDGLVKTWYDQSGNGTNLSSVSPYQPTIAEGGVVLKNILGHYTMKFDDNTAPNAKYFDGVASSAFSSIDCTIHHYHQNEWVHDGDADKQGGELFSFGLPGWRGASTSFRRNQNRIIHGDGSSNWSYGFNIDSCHPHLQTTDLNGDTIKLYLNGVEKASQVSGAAGVEHTEANFRVGCRNDASPTPTGEVYNGFLTELVVYTHQTPTVIANYTDLLAQRFGSFKKLSARPNTIIPTDLGWYVDAYNVVKNIPVADIKLPTVLSVGASSIVVAGVDWSFLTTNDVLSFAAGPLTLTANAVLNGIDYDLVCSDASDIRAGDIVCQRENKRSTPVLAVVSNTVTSQGSIMSDRTSGQEIGAMGLVTITGNATFDGTNTTIPIASGDTSRFTVGREVVHQLVWDGTYADIDELAKIWLLVGDTADQVTWSCVGSHWTNFILDDGAGNGITGSGSIRNFVAAFNAGGNTPYDDNFWNHELSLPLSGGYNGNPFYQSKAVALRGMISSLVDMINYDQDWGISEGQDEAFYVGKALHSWGLAYKAAHQYMTDFQRRTYETALISVFYRMRTYPTINSVGEEVKSLFGNMLVHCIPGFAAAYSVSTNTDFKNSMVGAAYWVLRGSIDVTDPPDFSLGKGALTDSGYVKEGNMPDTSYNGYSIRQCVQAMNMVWGDTAWDWLKNLIDNMCDWKTYKIHYDLGDGGGTLSPIIGGPSGYASRTGAGDDGDLDSSINREATLAIMFDEGKPFMNKSYNPQHTLVDAGTMVTEIQSDIATRNSQGFGCFSNKEYVWKSRSSWPVNGTFAPAINWYNTLLTEQTTPTQNSILPNAKTAGHNKRFGTEFWSYRGSTSKPEKFAFFHETMDRKDTSNNPWFGGLLQSLWYEDFGVVLMSRHDKSGPTPPDENTRNYSVIDTWATPHLWGYDSLDNEFSTAVGFDYGNANTISDHSSDPTPYIEVTTQIGANGQTVLTNVTATKRLTVATNGITYKLTTAPGAGTETVKELYWTIPVVLKLDGTRQSSLSNRTIEYWDGDAWASLPGTSTAADWIRIGVDYNEGGGIRYTWINFTTTQYIKSGPTWTQSYQGEASISCMKIDVHPTRDQTAQAFPTLNVEYTTTDIDPALVPSGASVSLLNPIVSEVLRSGGWIPYRGTVVWGSNGSGTIYFEHTINGTTWNTDSSSPENIGADTYRAFANVPSGIQKVRIRTVDGMSEEKIVEATVSAATETVMVSAEAFTNSDATVLGSAHNSNWLSATEDPQMSRPERDMQILSNQATSFDGTIHNSSFGDYAKLTHASMQLTKQFIKGKFNFNNPTITSGQKHKVQFCATRARRYYANMGALIRRENLSGVYVYTFEVYLLDSAIFDIESVNVDGLVTATGTYQIEVEHGSSCVIATLYESDGTTVIKQVALYDWNTTKFTDSKWGAISCERTSWVDDVTWGYW